MSALQAAEDGRRIRAQWGIAAHDLDHFGAVCAVSFGVTEVLRRLSDLEPTWPERPVTISIKPHEDGVIVKGQVIVP